MVAKRKRVELRNTLADLRDTLADLRLFLGSGAESVLRSSATIDGYITTLLMIDNDLSQIDHQTPPPTPPPPPPPTFQIQPHAALGSDSESVQAKFWGNEDGDDGCKCVGEEESVGRKLVEEEECQATCGEEHQEGNKKMIALRNEEVGEEDSDGGYVGEEETMGTGLLEEVNRLVPEEDGGVGCEEDGGGEDNVVTSLVGEENWSGPEDDGGVGWEQEEHDDDVEEEEEKEKENCKGGKGGEEGDGGNRELLNKMMEMMEKLYEMNEMQTGLLNSLSQRVEKIESALASDKSALASDKNALAGDKLGGRRKRRKT